MGEDVLVVKAAPTTETEGGVPENFGTDLLTLALENYCHFYDFALQELLHTLRMKSISLEVDLTGTDPT